MSVCLGAQAQSTSGVCGPNAVWKFEDQVLTVSGEGICNWDETWDTFQESVLTLIFEEGITHLGNTEYRVGGYKFTSLKSIKFPSTLKYIGTYWFAYCLDLTSVILPEGFEGFGGAEFFCNLSLSYLYLPSTIKRFGDMIFDHCYNLTTVVCKIPVPFTGLKNESIFGNADMSIKNLYVPSESVNAYDTTDVWKDFGGIFAITETFEMDTDTVYLSHRSTHQISLNVTPDNAGRKFICTSSNPNVASVSSTGLITAGLSGTATITVTTEDRVFTDSLEVNVDVGELCGDSVVWSFDESSGILSISGCYPMRDYERGTAPWYDIRDRIKTVTIEQWVSHIGNYAFADCSSLVSVILSDDVVSIGRYAFHTCASLIDVRFPPALYSIGEGAFGACTSLSVVIIPEGVTNIPFACFIGCSSLTYVQIPSTVTSIGGMVFAYCYYVQAAKIYNPTPPSLAGDALAFSAIVDLSVPSGSLQQYMDSYNRSDVYEIREFNSSAITEEDVPPDSLKITNGVLIPAFNPDIEDYTVEIKNKTNITITLVEGHEYFLIIGTGTFDLTSGERVFKVSLIEHDGTYKTYTINVNSIYSDRGKCGDNVEWILNGDSLRIFGNGYMYNFAEGNTPWAEYSKIIKFVSVEEGVTAIGANSFKDFHNAKTITLPRSLKEIREAAFIECRTVENIYISDSVSIIGSKAFYGCKNLKSITLPHGLKEISREAFSYCSAIDSIVIPEGVTVIWDYGFRGCTNLRKVIFPSTLVSIEYRAFMECFKLADIVLPNSVKHLAEGAFIDCDEFRSIRIPDSVTVFSRQLFLNCDRLETVFLPEGLTDIHPYVIRNCFALKEIQLPKSLKKLHVNSFENAGALKSITLPENVTEVERWSFAGCNSLEYISFPGSIQTIQPCFQNCPLLKTVWIENPNPLNIEESLITDILSNNPVLYVPAVSVDRYRQHPVWGLVNDIRGYDPSVTEIKSGAALTSIRVSNGVLRPKFDPLRTDYKIEVLDFNKPLVIEGVPIYGATVKGNITVMPVFGIHTINLNVLSEDSTNSRTYNLTYSVPAEGMCGNNVKWFLQDSLLRITGTGQMYDWEHGSAPWYNNRSSISKISIGRGVTSIGDYAFIACKNLKSTTIPQSVATIGDMAFSDCSGLQDVFNEYPFCQPIDGHTFLNVKTDSVTLWIPEEYIVLYKKAPIWEDFGKFNAYIPVERIEIDRDFFQGDTLLLNILDTVIKLNATIFPENATRQTVIWKSSNAKIATIDENGTVMFLDTGKVTLTVSTEYGIYADSIKAVRVINSNPKLKNLWISGGRIYPTFNPQYEYYKVIPDDFSDTGSITIHAEAEESTSTVTGTGAYNYPYQFKININVKAQDGTEKVHTLYIIPKGEVNWERDGDVLTVGSDGEFLDEVDWGFDVSEIKTLFIEEGTTKLGQLSLWYFTGLEYVSFPNSLQTVDLFSFWGSGLKEIVLPNNLGKLGQGAFADNFSLEHIQFSHYLDHIPLSCFYLGTNEIPYQSSIVRIVSPREVPHIPERGFDANHPYFMGNIDLSKTTAYVPALSIEDYRTAHIWKRCGAFEPIPLLESFNVYGNDSELLFTPSFDSCVFNYYLTVPNHVQSIDVSATGATSGTGTHNLSEGYNLLRIIANDITLYYLTVKREKAGGSAGIKNISAGKGEYVIYSADGRRLPKIEKGKINILKYKNGKVEKILIK